MEESIQNNNESKRIHLNFKQGLTIVRVIVLIVGGISLSGGLGGSGAKSAAEDRVKQSVYLSLGVVPQHCTSDVIYKNGDKRLIEVKYGLISTDWDGTYFVYTDGKNVMGCTNMMGSGYSFEEHLEEAKAVFGL